MNLRRSAVQRPGPANKRLAPRAYLALALVTLATISGCGPGGPSRLTLREDVARPEPGIVLFLVDGLPPRVVEQGCREGWLPNIQQRFRAGGATVRHATTSIPSITYSAITTLVSGTSPARHQIIGNHWFDPDQALFRDYVKIKSYDWVDDDHQAPLIYERIQPATSASIQTVHRRGATKLIRNWALSGTMWFFEDYTAVDKLTATSIWRVITWANQQRRWPTLVTFYFPGVDTIGHGSGPDSREFQRAVKHVDHQIGRVCDWLEAQGLLETTFQVLVSDHGMVNVVPDQRIDLLPLIRDQWGRAATDRMLQDEPANERRRFYDQFDTVLVHQDGRAVSLHFRGPSGWNAPPPAADVEAILTTPSAAQCLWNVPGVQLVAYLAGPNEAVVRSPAGRARIIARDGASGREYAYVPDPDDVLGYLDESAPAAFVSGGFHDSRAWLAVTADQPIPDLVPHAIPLLRVRRSGQVVVFAQPGYSFVRENGGHGGIDADEQLMTFCMAGPEIQPGSSIETARAVDLVPTLLDLLSIEHDEDEWLEGVSLLEAGLLALQTGEITGSPRAGRASERLRQSRVGRASRPPGSGRVRADRGRDARATLGPESSPDVGGPRR